MNRTSHASTSNRSATLWRACVVAATLAVAGLPAQDKPPILRKPGPSPSVELHEAWLKETLDLDPQAAIRTYDRIRMKAPKAQPERWLAVARILELQRIGVTSPEPGTIPRGAPEKVQEVLESIEMDVPFEKLLSNPRSEQELPPLRQATRRLQEWARDQIGPTVEERIRLGVRISATNSTDPETQAKYRLYAAREVLRVEIAGSDDRAEAMRTIDFPDWTPPKIVGEPRAALALALRRLDEWISESELWMNQSLRNLKKYLAENGEDPQQALEFVQELPIIGDRLLAPPGEAQGDGDESGR